MSSDTTLVEYRLESGATITFESEQEKTAAGAVRGQGSRQDTEIIGKASETIESEIRKLQPVLQSIQSILKDINNPSELTLELGLEFTATAGVIVSNFSSKANIKITLKWSNH